MKRYFYVRNYKEVMVRNFEVIAVYELPGHGNLY